jgi:soluble lytic murein transglycosylase-like protein
MARNEAGTAQDLSDRRPRAVFGHARPHSDPRTRTIVIRHGTAWLSLAFLLLCFLLIAAVLLGHYTIRGLDARNEEAFAAMARAERRLQQLESGLSFDSKRRQTLLGMRNHIMKANPRVSLRDAYRYAELALEASEKYPAVDPLLLLAIGIVESGYDPMARSRADARGLYQIWPSTGRLLVRTLGWNYDDSTLYDPVKNTEAAALYLDVLFSTYSDPQMVLAEYNGGPLNAGYYRAGAGQLAGETRNYVPRVLELYTRLQQEFEKGPEPQPEVIFRDAQREGKTLEAARAGAGPRRSDRVAAPAVPARPRANPAAR